MVKKYISFLRIILFFIFLSAIPNKIYAQCAGEDGALTVCDIPAASSKSIDLYAQLTGSPLSGGVWTDVDSSGGLDLDTGILNAQLIRRSGTFRYLYTVEGIGLCPDNTATVTVTIGGYSGVTSPNVSVCSAIGEFSLFSAFNGVDVSPQSNGQWHNDTTNQNVNAIINVTDMEGTYQFTYTMPAIGTCPAMSSTAFVTVFKAPRSGSNDNLRLCASDGLTAYTNYDLNNLLSNQDPGGTWTEVSNTGELTYVGDHFVNVQRIYTNLGKGNFYYRYTVKSKNPICPDAQTTIAIILEEKLDFTGAELKIADNNICETAIPTATYTATITKGPAAIPNGDYYVSFNVSGVNGGSETLPVNFINGVAVFPLKSDYFQQVGSYSVTINDIYGTNSARACRNIINNLSKAVNIFPIPDLAGAKITPVNTCQNAIAEVKITDAVKIVDGVYDIVYSISGVNNASSQTASATFSGGNAFFYIPAILNAQSGNGTIKIVKITHGVSGCTNSSNVPGDIVVNPLPNISNLRVQVAPVCFGSVVTASVSGLGTLTDVTLSYSLSNSNVAPIQTIALLPVSGNASFAIPATLLANTGSTTIKIENVKNNITGCDSPVTTVSANFSINPIPAAPVSTDQTFCKSEGAIIGNLAPSGPQFKWYNSPTLATPLANTYVLKEETYYVTETTLSCTSAPTMIKVILKDSPAPVLADQAKFCGINNPTISDLSNKTNVPSSVVWYDAPKNGNVLSSTTILRENITYYGFDFDTTTDCLSSESLPVIADLTDCNTIPDTFFVPDGFSPNGDGINDTFVIPDIDFLYPDYTLEIFNRYGNGMYRSYKNKPGWDGINYETQGLSHGVAPNGVYFYILNFNKDNRPPQQGRLYLNR
ncbi:gliding motility-associated C-terminal domain-containing protein [Flavobacterium sp. LHD-80]|uniref:gliding motility-associated C-terminal domain-containing protein n=1 Tax=Flavobacterium sp. LHD-80 TaxID=3071411 RepID=UPI0027E02D2D|nr:gliding motility-associated C-terminal domain-containing protein [Flavobacterium sp. LHD-80]MDQ6469185.1 gliding motility-associated C-terminal domain-containing protein [Flavobacterium sp. LHD-80]